MSDSAKAIYLETAMFSWMPDTHAIIHFVTVVTVTALLSSFGLNEVNGEPLKRATAEPGSSDVIVFVDTGGLFQPLDRTIVSVVVSPDTWVANRIGQRQQLVAHAFNASGQSIPYLQFEWTSSDTNVAQVNNNGLVTSFNTGQTDITATIQGKANSTALTVVSEVESDVGDMYTVWFARSDSAPALLVNGRLEVAKDIYCLNINADPDAWMVCPGHANYPDPVVTYDSDGNIVSVEDPSGTINDPGVLPAPPIPSYPNPVDPTSPWPYPNVAKFQWAKDRIGMLSDMSQGHGTFRVRDRHAEWIALAIGNASDFQLSGNRIGVLVNDGELRVKDGTFGTWTNLGTDVVKFVLEGDYIGVLHEDGMFQVKQGIMGTWTLLGNPGSNIQDFSLELYAGGTQIRIAEVFENGSLRVKDGVNDVWTTLSSGGVDKIQLEQNLIAVLGTDGQLLIKIGTFGSWTTLAATGSDVADFALQVYSNEANVRIAELMDSGLLRVKDGINSPWTDISTGVVEMQLQDTYIGALLGDGTLRIKEHINGSWRNTSAYGASISQFRLAVDVPVPPSRTTPQSYAANQANCAIQQVDNNCSPVRSFGLPTGFYGRFCGGSRPGNWYWAVGIGPQNGGGPMDGMDALCWQHDAAYPQDDPPPEAPWASWYPEDYSGWSQSYLCVVRYGLEYARLTRNGSVVQADTNSHGVWNGMPNLYNAIYSGAQAYWTGAVSGCSTGSLEQFVIATDAKFNK